jgi:hypothetical protein
MTELHTLVALSNGSYPRFGLSRVFSVGSSYLRLPTMRTECWNVGILLAAATWVIRGTMFVPSGGIIQNFGSVQEVLFLEVSLTESASFLLLAGSDKAEYKFPHHSAADWLIFITRGADKFPSWQLVGAVFGVDVLATIFALFGWLSGPAPHGGWLDVVTVVRIYCYSIGVTVVLALVYYILNHLPFLDNLGRSRRGQKNKVIEDFITELQRLTIVHEEGGQSSHVYRCVAVSLTPPDGQQVKRARTNTTTCTTSKRRSSTADLVCPRAAHKRLPLKDLSERKRGQGGGSCVRPILSDPALLLYLLPFALEPLFRYSAFPHFVFLAA